MLYRIPKGIEFVHERHNFRCNNCIYDTAITVNMILNLMETSQNFTVHNYCHSY